MQTTTTSNLEAAFNAAKGLADPSAVRLGTPGGLNPENNLLQTPLINDTLESVAQHGLTILSHSSILKQQLELTIKSLTDMEKDIQEDVDTVNSALAELTQP